EVNVPGDAFEPNDFPTSAAQLDDVGNTSSFYPNLSIHNPLRSTVTNPDLYTFNLTASGGPNSFVAIDFDFTGGALGLYLYNEFGYQLDFSTDAGTSQEI